MIFSPVSNSSNHPLLSLFYYKTGTMSWIGSTSYVLPIRLSYHTLRGIAKKCLRSLFAKPTLGQRFVTTTKYAIRKDWNSYVSFGLTGSFSAILLKHPNFVEVFLTVFYGQNKYKFLHIISSTLKKWFTKNWETNLILALRYGTK